MQHNKDQEEGSAQDIEVLIEALRDKDSGVRKQASEALNQLGWQPVNETQSALLAIAQQDWDRVVSLGSAAVESLIDVLGDSDSDVSESATRVLEQIGDRRGADAILEHRFSDNSVQAPPPPTFFLSEISDPRGSIPPKIIFDPYAPRTHSGGMRPPPKLENSSALPLRKWLAFIIAIPILVLLASIVATIVIKTTRVEHLPPTAGLWDVLLFVCQMILLTIAVCFTPTFVAFFFYRSGRIVSLLIEIVAYIVIFLGFAFWFLGASALGIWLFYAIALVLLIDIGSHYIEWYKDNTLKRIKNAVLYQSIEIDVKALEKMKHDEVALYVPVPVGLALGTIIGLVLRQTTVQILALCLQIVLLLSSFVLLYFLIVGFLRMADPLFKTIPKFLPALTKSRQKGRGKLRPHRYHKRHWINTTLI
ncbi:hypothetical protein [Ktedonobacter robiniae]|uniref:HEAT repeat domain-containing protein n=1 Tax=Ktedonobacter robiniae TaxID=2778365 RepID=A0ABQ3V0E6_9CHLR|nr:hypothetical protein [Ktedonobacter robiniae]GHO58077.1 hypothetical protein KSB_65520 [Ktedonobacter robiniae]